MDSFSSIAAVRAPLAPTDLAFVLGGGGARGAYQAGLLRGIARRYPELQVPILVGISAGAVNATHLASHRAGFRAAMDDLVRIWLSLTPEQVFHVDGRTLFSNMASSGIRLVGGGRGQPEGFKGMVDTGPLRSFLEQSMERRADGTLPGIDANLARGTLRAVALCATSYTTSQSVTWVQSTDDASWERPQRTGISTRLTVEHVMASTALPLLFPAARVGNEWYGDGGIRLTAPHSPALHLGASRILTISTRHVRSRRDTQTPQVVGYPPPAQVLGVLYNSIFLDVLDQDAVRLEHLNQLVRRLPENDRGGYRLVDLLVLRPSRDLGKLAAEYEPRLPRVLRFLTRGLGTRQTSSPDILSLIMFQEDYVRALVELGEEDAEREADRIDAFMSRPARETLHTDVA